MPSRAHPPQFPFFDEVLKKRGHLAQGIGAVNWEQHQATCQKAPGKELITLVKLALHTEKPHLSIALEVWRDKSTKRPNYHFKTKITSAKTRHMGPPAKTCPFGRPSLWKSEGCLISFRT